MVEVEHDRHTGTSAERDRSVREGVEIGVLEMAGGDSEDDWASHFLCRKYNSARTVSRLKALKEPTT